MILEDRCRPFASLVRGAKELGFYPYYRPISRSWGPEVEVGGRRLVMIGSNDYLGLSHHPLVLEKAAESMKRWGSGPGGSRLLCGNITLHEILEERLAAFVGKKKALIHPTGFSTNLGALSCILSAKDVILCDRENHASIYEGSRASHARLIPFAHNDFKSAAEKMASAFEKHPDACILLATEGVFSMSGDTADLPGLVQLKTQRRRFYIYLDDAHGIGVMGRKGSGTADHFGLTADIDFIMGTFSKALASIGGFIASDHEDVLEYVKHHSNTMIFSAALPAINAAAVLASIEILEQEPERVVRLHEITRIARRGYQDIGLLVPNSETPILPILVGSEEKAYHFATDLFNHGVFAPPAVYPAVPKGRAVIRTAYMSTHENRHIAHVLEVLNKLASKHQIRSADLDIRHTPISEGIAAADASPII